MKKRFLIWYWSPSGGGGSQFAVNLAHRLMLLFGPDAIKLSLHGEDPLLERARTFAFETRAAIVSSHRRKPLTTLMSIARSAEVLAEHARDCDVVLLPMNFASAAPLAMSLRKPLIYFAHDPEPHPGDYAALAQRATQAVLFKRAERVVALSGYAAAQLRTRVPTQKLVTIPLSAVFKPQPVQPLSAGPVRFLFAGRMIAYKGLDLLADALPRLFHRRDWTLTIAGDGPALDSQMRARLEERGVEVQPGWMSEAALDALIARSDVFVAPYRSATQSGVVTQALAHGRPCLVTPVGALPEQIEMAGWVTEAVDSAAIADALCSIVDHQDALAAKSAAAHAIAQRSWSADAVWTRLVDQSGA